MPSSLLKSQFETLEEPKGDEQDVVTVSIDQSIAEIC
jgi:gluconokinase